MNKCCMHIFLVLIVQLFSHHERLDVCGEQKITRGQSVESASQADIGKFIWEKHAMNYNRRQDTQPSHR